MHVRPKLKTLTALLAASFFLYGLSTVTAAVTIRVIEDGGDVTMAGEGTLNLDDLFLISSDPINGGFLYQGSLLIGEVNGNGHYAGLINEPLDSHWMPMTDPLQADLAQNMGQLFGLMREVLPAVNADQIENPLQPCSWFDGGQCVASAISVPLDYESGSLLQSSSTFRDSSLASMGLKPGQYVWSWGSGASADSLTLEIVPEPTYGPEFLVLFVLGGLRMRGRNQFSCDVRN